MRFARSAFCSALLLLGFSGAAISLRVDNRGELAADRAVPDTPEASRTLRKNPTPPEQRIANGDWADRLRSEDFWQQMRSPQSRPERWRAPRPQLGKIRNASQIVGLPERGGTVEALRQPRRRQLSNGLRAPVRRLFLARQLCGPARLPCAGSAQVRAKLRVAGKAIRLERYGSPARRHERRKWPLLCAT